MTNRYQIPQPEEDPSEELIQFLHENVEEWEGDAYGIILIHDDGIEEFGVPGDWVVCDEFGHYSIEKESKE